VKSIPKIIKNKMTAETDTTRKWNEKGFDHDHVSDLDVPGSELDDAQEKTGE
jgi:hypothetical protein